MKKKLRLFWNKKEGIMIYCPEFKAEGHLVSMLITNDFLDMMEKHGYDKTTFKFEITKKEPSK